MAARVVDCGAVLVVAQIVHYAQVVPVNAVWTTSHIHHVPAQRTWPALFHTTTMWHHSTIRMRRGVLSGSQMTGHVVTLTVAFVAALVVRTAQVVETGVVRITLT